MGNRRVGIGLIAAGIILFISLTLFSRNGTPTPANITAPRNSPEKTTSMKLQSPAFKNGENLPPRYTCDGKNVNPPFQISEAPTVSRSLVLIMDDPDAPGGTWDHWVIFNIPSEKGSPMSIPEGESPAGVGGNNSWGKTGYGGPCPPSGSHRYIFRLYALDTTLTLPSGSSKNEVLSAMKGHVIEQTELVGRYERK